MFVHLHLGLYYLTATGLILIAINALNSATVNTYIEILRTSCFDRTVNKTEQPKRLTDNVEVHFLGLPSVDSVSPRRLWSGVCDYGHQYTTDILCVRWTLHNKVSCRLIYISDNVLYIPVPVISV